jgi:hypothetical protein
VRKLVAQVIALSLDGYICEEETDFWRLFGPAAVPPARGATPPRRSPS